MEEQLRFYLSQTIEGVSMGSLYGLIGLAAMLVYRSSRVFNFSQGELATAISFAAFAFLAKFNPWISVLLSFGVAFLLGAIQVGYVQLIRERTPLATATATIGFFSIINSVNSFFFGFDPYTFPSPFPEGGTAVYGIHVSYQSIGTLACALLISLLLFLFFKFTLYGVAFQAMSEDALATRLKGVRVGMLAAMSWGVSAIISGSAGMLAAHSLNLHPNTMGPVMMYAFSAAKIGGLQSSFGALAGGIIVGVTENLAGTVSWIGSDLKSVAVFAVLLIFLIVRPRGLFGRDEPRRI